MGATFGTSPRWQRPADEGEWLPVAVVTRSKLDQICADAVDLARSGVTEDEPGEHLQPGDLGIGDVMVTAPDDDRLVPGYVLSDDPAIEEVAWELGLGRVRVMSREGRDEAAQRWYDGDHGPDTPIAAAAPSAARC